MMNSIETQPVTTIAPPLPNPESPQVPLDPTNPLVWILLITPLLGNTDEVINAITALIREIASLRQGNDKDGKGRRSDRDR